MSTRLAVLQVWIPGCRRGSHASVCLQEWHQKCSHYFILTASAGALMDQALLVPRTKLRPSPVASPGQPPSSVPSCRARPIPTCVEGLGMASSCLWGGYILLTGGISRTGRGAETRVLLRDQEGWSMVCTEQSAGPGQTLRVTEKCRRRKLKPFALTAGMRLHHSATPLPGGAVLLYGGRSSPLRPVTDLLRVSFQPCSPALGAQKIQVEPLTCTGDSPPPRWRHTAAAVRHRGHAPSLFSFCSFAPQRFLSSICSAPHSSLLLLSFVCHSVLFCVHLCHFSRLSC